MNDKIDVARLAREATRHAMRDGFSDLTYRIIRDEHFARLVMEEAAKVCETEAEKWEGDGTVEPMARLCAIAIRARMP